MEDKNLWSLTLNIDFYPRSGIQDTGEYVGKMVFQCGDIDTLHMDLVQFINSLIAYVDGLVFDTEYPMIYITYTDVDGDYDDDYHISHPFSLSVYELKDHLESDDKNMWISVTCEDEDENCPFDDETLRDEFLFTTKIEFAYPYQHKRGIEITPLNFRKQYAAV